MALRSVLILRKPRSGCLEGRTALIQPIVDSFTSSVWERVGPSLKSWVGDGVGVPRSALLCLLCLILYAPGLASIPPVDRNEARFAQATRQMPESGDFIRIRFQEEARNKKPIRIHWLQAAPVALFSRPGSTAIRPYRLPSALAIFLLGTVTRLATAAPGDRQLAGAGMALVDDRADAAFRKSSATRGLNLSAVDRVSGLDYSAGGGRVILILCDLEPR